MPKWTTAFDESFEQAKRTNIPLRKFTASISQIFNNSGLQTRYSLSPLVICNNFGL